MRTSYKLTIAALGGVLIGAGGVRAIRAQQAQAPPGYVIAEVEVTDPSNMRKYGEKVPDTLAAFPHHYVVLGGKPQGLEGEPPKSIVVIAFDSAAKAREWYDSPAYAAVRPIRQAAAKSRIYIVEGVAGQ
jgi:uncharacterized protein (DUF1330 family)